MASEESPVGNSSHSESSDNRYYIEQVKTYLSPLESRWKYVQTVLLWEKPTHSLCYFIAMTAIFGALAGGKFRMVLLLVVMLASSLFLDDVRVKVWHLLQQGGLGAIDKDADSHNTSLSFLRLCERLAGLWSCFEAWYNKLNKLKAGNSCKYYGILFGLLLVAVFAYQYLPLMVLSYLMACSMFFWPVVKHHGMHKRVKNTLAPFFMPFVVQWQHSRTKRQRDTVLKVADREGDSDEEFSKNFAPNAVNHHNALLGEDGSALDSSSADPPPEVKFLDGIISSAVAQGLNSIIMKKEEEIGSIYDTPSETPHHETLESRSPSVDSSAVFLGGLQFPSVSQTTDNFEFQEGEYMEGLEFPDIEQDSDSESEPFRSINESQLDKKPKEVATSQEKGTLSKENACNPGLNITENVTHSLGNSDVSEDYEMLERSDAEGMTLIDESDNVDSATEGLGSVTNYVGKWLGY